MRMKFWFIVLPTCTFGFVPLSTTTPRLFCSHSFDFAATSRSSSSTPEIEEIFSKDLASELASEIESRISLPFIPGPALLYVLSEAIQRVSSDLSIELVQRIKEVLAASVTPTDYDDFSPDNLTDLAQQVAQELNGRMDAPILDEEQELLVLTEIFKVVFDYLSVSDAAKRRLFIESEIKFSKDLFGSEKSRRCLVQNINEAIDIPLLNENQEEGLLLKAVETCAEALQELLPPELIQTLKGEQPESMLAMKTWLVEKVNNRVDLVGFNEEQEETLIRTVVGMLLDQYVDGTEMEFLVLSPEEQQEKLKEKYNLIEREIILSKQRFDREQQNLRARLDRLKTRLQ